jgi:glycosyltransferase involved in cell wall biosynthesis
MTTFRICEPRNTSNPEVLFTGDLADPRKGGLLLLRAWNTVHRRCPESRLVLAGSFGLGGFAQVDSGRTVLANLHLVRDPAARAAIEIRGPGSVEALGAWYSRASVTVLPSVEEAFGMVLTESLACGTPVVASGHHGPAEIVTSPEIGVTVDLKDWLDLQSSEKAEQLADAILTAIELSVRPGVAARCRDWASQWSVEKIGLQEEALLEEIISGKSYEIESSDGQPELATSL